MRHKILLSAPMAALAALALTACAGGDRGDEPPPGAEARAPKRAERSDVNAGPCPLMGVLYDASRMVTFTGEERFANVSWTGEVDGVSGLCRYTGTDPIITNLVVDFSFGRGPAADGETHTYRYWVAVTRTNLAVLNKQYFEVTAEFPRGERIVRVREEIDRIVIPRSNADVAGGNFEILVGFDVSPEQLAFNRAGKRFRVDVGG